MYGQGFNTNLKFCITEVRKKMSDDACFILDNGSTHDKELPQFPGVQYILLLPNVTSECQALDKPRFKQNF